MDSGRKEDLLRRMDRAHPDRNYLAILESEEIKSGWETQLEILRVRYEQGGRQLEEQVVLRCHQGSQAHDKARREYAVLQFLGESEIAVPRVLGFLAGDTQAGGPCLIMKHIPGQTVAESLSGRKASAIRAHLDRMLTPLVLLHRLPWQGTNAGKILNDDWSDHDAADAAGWITRLEREISRYQLLEFHPLIAWLWERLPVDVEPRLSLCHNDYHPQNLLVTQPEGKVVVLDWSYCSIDDYRLDLAWSMLLFGTMLGAEIRGQALRSYERLSGERVSHFEFFQGLKLTQRMVTLATWLTGEVVSPVRKITPQTMRGSYRVHVLNVYQRLVEITGIRLQIFESL